MVSTLTSSVTLFQLNEQFEAWLDIFEDENSVIGFCVIVDDKNKVIVLFELTSSGEARTHKMRTREKTERRSTRSRGETRTKAARSRVNREVRPPPTRETFKVTRPRGSLDALSSRKEWRK